VPARAAAVLLAFTLALVAACRAGFAPGVTHRWHDGKIVSSVQGEVGGYFPHSHLGGFVSLGSAEPVGENEGHAGWIWELAEGRYRRVFAHREHATAYWAAGAEIGGGSRGPVGGSHGEIGLERPFGRLSVDFSLRHRLLVIGDGDLTRVFNQLQVAVTFGWATSEPSR
jgi:hypothetical protein